MLESERHQRATRSDFEQAATNATQPADTLGEAYRLAQMARPVVRIGRFVCRDPVSSQTRDKRDLWDRKLHLGARCLKLWNYWVHHLRMERVRGGEAPANYRFVR